MLFVKGGGGLRVFLHFPPCRDLTFNSQSSVKDPNAFPYNLLLLVSQFMDCGKRGKGPYNFPPFPQHPTGNGASRYRDKYFKPTLEALGMDHTPHETRHTFRTRLDSAGANKRCIDLMMGHKSKDVGERVYTHKTLDELWEAIEIITR